MSKSDLRCFLVVYVREQSRISQMRGQRFRWGSRQDSARSTLSPALTVVTTSADLGHSQRMNSAKFEPDTSLCYGMWHYM